MKAVLYVMLLMSFRVTIAQNYRISGTVQDAAGEVVPGANIRLKCIAQGTSCSMHRISNATGGFLFGNLSAGAYFLTTTYVGYTEITSDTIWLQREQPDYVYHITLLADSTVLRAVEVTAKKELVEIGKGKMVFNVQNMTTTSGLTAFDMLKKLPGITVDQNENISLRGSAGINVLMDGRMTYLSGTQLTNYLKSISAEDINKIELNITPSAEYDAAGNAGIINIVPKKNMKQGYAVGLRAGVSKAHYWMTNENMSASYRAKTFSVYGMVDFKMPRNLWKGKSGNSIQNGSQPIQLLRQSESAYQPLYYSWRAGAEWQLLPKHKLSVDYDGYFDDWKAIYSSAVTSVDQHLQPISSIGSRNALVEPYYYNALNLNYRYDIDSSGKKITAETHYISYRNYSDGVLTTDTYDANADFTGRNVLRSHQPGFIKIKSAKADAELPFKKLLVKAGLKYAEVENDNRFHFDSLHNGGYEEVESMSNHFRYKERIAAAYISASKKINKTSMDAGLRLEYTKATGQTINLDVANNWEYTNLFPSLSVEQQLASSDKVTVSVSRRINRPSYSELNPVRWYVDQFFYYSGNPNLLPEMTWVSSLAYSLQRKYVFTISYGHNNNYINRRLLIDTNGVSIKSQPANLGTMQRLDLIASLPFQPFSFWELQFLPNLSYMSYPVSQLDGEKALSRWFATFGLQQQFTLPAGFKADVSVQYNTTSLRGIYLVRPYVYADVGLKKSVFKDKLDIQLSCSDIFNGLRYRGRSQSDITDYYYKDKPDSRRMGITLHYHFGSDLVKGNSKKTDEQERL